MDIDTSLLREKFEIEEKNAQNKNSALKIVCPSTRMLIDLKAGETTSEIYAVRTNSMHSCVRMVAQMVMEFEKRGPIVRRVEPLDWSELWHNALSGYDRTFNHKRWVSIHHNGKVIYSSGEYHSFFDIIEKFDVINKGKYENSIQQAENAFKQSGRDVTIKYDTNVALVAALGKEGGRCSMVLRGPDRTTTFNYSLKPLEIGVKMNTAQALNTAADFLEGVQLSYMIGINMEKLNHGMIERYSEEDKQTQSARKRIIQLDSQINSMETRYAVRYRPERPNFNKLVKLAEEFAKNFVIKDADETYI